MLIRLGQPSGLAVPLDQMKRELVVNFDDDDDRIEKLTRSETSRYEIFTRRIMVPGNFEMCFGCFARRLFLDVGPVRSVIEIAYFDEDGVEHTVSDDLWSLEPADTTASIRFGDAFVYPDLGDGDWPVRVRFSGGYDLPDASGSGDDPALAQDPADATNIMHLVKRIYDGGEIMSEADMRRMMSGRRVLR
ncbi:hypothetical protein [Martelella endophytica]|uniref:Uncharacterized protein n=1 Tax=Martelella endophytica TaxID=1486262 RepID=A0A0D5LMY0_MAREN|nr:hypothetical protein [Martelella endophytica]AJY44668.1 hypothetical protein TM49_01590 [Martelella endophytica]